MFSLGILWDKYGSKVQQFWLRAFASQTSVWSLGSKWSVPKLLHPALKLKPPRVIYPFDLQRLIYLENYQQLG